MAWIESHEGLARHPKTKKLARLLSENVPSAIGRLHLLWWWSLEYAQDGNLGRFEPDDIAEAMMWENDSNELIESMCESGFIDVNPDGTLQIHDWDDYAGRLLEKREQNAERMRKARAQTKKKRASNVQRTSRTRVGLPTVPTVPTVPTNQKSSSDIPGDAVGQSNESTLQETMTTPLPPEPNSLDEYCKRIENRMVTEGANPNYIAKQNSFDWVKTFHAADIPIEFVMNGISQVFDRERKKGATVTNFAYCAGPIQDLWMRELASREPAKQLDYPAATSAASDGRNRARPRDVAAKKDDRYANFYELFPNT